MTLKNQKRLTEVAEKLNCQKTVRADIVEKGGEEVISVKIEHDEWRTTNLYPGQYDRIVDALEGSWEIRDFQIRQKESDELERRDQDHDMVVVRLVLSPGQ